MALSLKLLFNLFVIFAAFPSSYCQQAEAPSPAANSCNGIFLSYSYIDGAKIPPNLKSNPASQPYRFESALTVLNNGLEELKSWRVFVGFHNNELLVSASNAVLADGSKLPVLVGNGTILAGFPSADLKTAVETAGDMTRMQVKVDLIGTQFGVASPEIPMPLNISLVNDGYACGDSTKQGVGTREMQVCCIPDSKIKTNISISDDFLPRQDGDLVIVYDVTKTYDSSYWAQVTISNHNPLGRLDNWKLSWDWMMGEFIYAMRGAYPYVVDSSECIFGSQGSHYQAMDFSEVLNCERRPTIVDLPLTKANDTDLGLIPYCCRNGTILPPHMDPSKSKSSFQMQVFKMPPELNRSRLAPPQNWKINGSLNPSYHCGPPIRVSPSQFHSPTGLPSQTTAVASWQIVCNTSQPKSASPKCCVSFSAYYNESVIPCRTCSCGCPTNTSRTCSLTSSAMLLPPEALLVPFDNRTERALSWAALKHFPVPNPTPCGDNCGVSINWHVYTDYSTGWSARITLFNWDDFDFADWFVAVEMNRTSPGFQATYSFNGTILELDGANNTIFMQGLPGLNYLVREKDGDDPDKDPRLPGKQQSVISFTKKNIQGISVPAGDGFPSKVFFNGEECLIPQLLPSAASFKVPPSFFSLVLSILMIIFVH